MLRHLSAEPSLPADAPKRFVRFSGKHPWPPTTPAVRLRSRRRLHAAYHPRRNRRAPRARASLHRHIPSMASSTRCAG